MDGVLCRCGERRTGGVNISLRCAGGRIKGAILSRERMAPLDPPRERKGLCPLTPPLQASSSKRCGACRLHFPARGVAALGAAIRFDLLLLSAAALPVSWQCSLIPVYRQSPQCGERSNAAFGRQSVARQTSLAPHDSKARLQSVPNRRDSWRSHVHRTHTAQRVQSFKLQSRNVGGRGGLPSSLLLGV